MDAYIKGITLFHDNSSSGKSFIELSRGFNIISGESKTGKSALIDIIDWCLGATECKIPKGKITKFANLYVLLINLNGKDLLISRQDEYKGKNLISIEEVDKSITINSISFDYFKNTSYIKIKDFHDKVNSIIDVTVDPNKIPFDFEKKIPKTNIRHTLPFIFQTQDIIDSKIKLFYDEPKTNHFPVLAGWFGPEYYEILKKIDKLNVSIKNLKKRKDDSKIQNQLLISNFRNSLRQHYNLNGIEFDENWTINECIQRIKKLEQYTKVEYSNDLQKRQDELIEILNKEASQLTAINKEIKKIERNVQQGGQYKTFIDKYSQRNEKYDINTEYVCPICGQENEELTIKAINIYQANEWLKKELTNVPVNISTFEAELTVLKSQESKLKESYFINKKEFDENKKTLEKIFNLKNLNEIKQKAQWKVVSDYEIYKSRLVEFDEKFYFDQIAELDKLKERKQTYNENDIYFKTKHYLEEKMSLNVANLDFEHIPPNLYLDFHPQKDSQFKLYHINIDEETIYLNRIGSASNALACHIGLFLSFLEYFANQPKSKVPTILFLDQPSQVYFPSGRDNTDVKKVAQIYETILDKIQEIEAKTGINPQIIIADHVKDLGEENVKLYEHYFKADFRNGNALVPNDFD